MRVNGWSVNSRDDLLKNLKYLEDGGNRALFDEIATALKSSDPDKAFDELLKRHSETYGREKLLDRRTVVAKYGDKLGKPLPLAVKMECLLEKAAEKRRHVLDRLRRSAVQLVVNSTYEVAEHDMKDMWQRGSLERGILSLGVMGGRLG